MRKRVESREQAARARLECQMLDMAHEDHVDLSTMIANIDKKDVPEEMAVLWEHQKTIMGTTSSRAYRWHPK